MKYLGWAFPVVVLIGLLGTTYPTYVIHKGIEQTHQPTMTGPIWFVSGLQVDLVRFENTVLSYMLGKVEHQVVTARYDILWSRADVITKGKVLQDIKAQSRSPTVLADVFETIKSVETDVFTLHQQDTSTASAIIASLREHFSEIEELKLELLETRSLTERSFRESIINIDQQKNVIFGMTMLLGLLLAFYLLLSQVRQKRALAEKTRLLRMARRANEAKSNFLSVVNHELRTPLTAISGSIKLLKATNNPENKTAAKLVDMAERNCEQLGALINDILDVERIEHGTMSYQFQSLDLAETVIQTANSLQTYMKERDVDIVCSVCDEARVLADPKRITQVLINLLSNAIKFSPEGATVDVHVRQARNTYEVEIRDYGRGIPTDALPLIFDRFYQAEEADRRNQNGSGLGLNIVRAIVSAHQGEISVESTVGVGSIFTIAFPVYVATAADDGLAVA